MDLTSQIELGHILAFSRALGDPNQLHIDVGYAASRVLAGSSPRRPSYPRGWMLRLSYKANRTVVAFDLRRFVPV